MNCAHDCFAPETLELGAMAENDDAWREHWTGGDESEGEREERARAREVTLPIPEFVKQRNHR